MSRATQGEQDNYEMHVRAANIVSHQVEGPGRLRCFGVPTGGFLSGGQIASQEEGCLAACEGWAECYAGAGKRLTLPC